jgi:hypothetical protein
MTSSSEKGVSNIYLDEVLFQVSKTYRGCFASDCIPKHLTKEDDFSLICNLSKRSDKGSHFVSIVSTNNKMYYLDPLGLPCFVDGIANFLRACNKPVLVNETQVQDVDSYFCGFFCMLFVIAFDHKCFWQLRFFKSDLKRNDDLCITYIKEILK